MHTNLVAISSSDLDHVTGGNAFSAAAKGIKAAAPVVKKWGGKALEWGGKAIDGINAAQSVKDGYDAVKGWWSGGDKK